MARSAHFLPLLRVNVYMEWQWRNSVYVSYRHHFVCMRARACVRACVWNYAPFAKSSPINCQLYRILTCFCSPYSYTSNMAACVGCTLIAMTSIMSPHVSATVCWYVQITLAWNKKWTRSDSCVSGGNSSVRCSCSSRIQMMMMILTLSISWSTFTDRQCPPNDLWDSAENSCDLEGTRWNNSQNEKSW